MDEIDCLYNGDQKVLIKDSKAREDIEDIKKHYDELDVQLKNADDMSKKIEGVVENAQNVLDSVPEDYSKMSNDVEGLNSLGLFYVDEEGNLCLKVTGER